MNCDVVCLWKLLLLLLLMMLLLLGCLKSKQLCIFLMGLEGDDGLVVVVSDNRLGLAGCCIVCGCCCCSVWTCLFLSPNPDLGDAAGIMLLALTASCVAPGATPLNNLSPSAFPLLATIDC